MSSVIAHINIGSNVNKTENIASALAQLKLVFGHLDQSSVYQSPAFGFVGDDFYNTAVNIKTTQNISQISQTLKTIEKKLGRKQTIEKFSPRPIDLDLVIYGNAVSSQDNLPRSDIVKYAFVLAPLAELLPQEKHPILNISYHALWQNFDSKQKNKLHIV